MILKNKVYTDIEFLDLVCNHSRTYTNIDRNVKHTIDQIATIINGAFFEVLWHYPLDEADYLNKTHPDDTYVIVEALYNDVPVKRFFELPSNSAIIKEALNNDFGCMAEIVKGDDRMFDSRFEFGDFRIEPVSCHLDTDLADSIMDTLRYAQIIDEDRAKAKAKIKEYEKMKIENVIFNDPATIVFWRDGSKTVVKAKDEPYDPEKGLAMAIAKKVYGNEGNYYNEFKKFIKDDAKEEKNEH